ncbi:hypothetical protein JCM8547_003699 [Rhodosporidiobolus lusitaniae]
MSAERDQFRSIPNALSTVKHWWNLPSMVRLNWFISVIFVGQALNGFDDGINGNLQSFDSWHEALGNPSSSDIGLLNASAYLAGLCTAPAAWYVSDRWGRRWCVRWSALCALLGTTLGCIAGAAGHGYALFVVSRIVFGSGLAFGLMISPVILQELSHPFQRETIAALFNPNYAIGGFICAWISFGTSFMPETSSWNWRLVYLLQLAPALYLLISIQFVPETPRWLMSKGREEEARAILVKYHGNGDPSDELVLFEIEEIKEALKNERELRQDTWREVFAKKGNRHRIAIVLLIVICQNLSGTAIIGNYYTQILALVGITGTTKQTGINVGLTGTVWAGAMTGVYLVGRLKRRVHLMGAWTALICVSIAFTTTAALYQRNGNLAAGKANVAFLYLYDFCFFLACGPLFFAYQVECLPFSMRAKGAFIWGVTNKVISVFNAYVNSIALGNIGWKYYTVYNTLLVCQLIGMYFLCVETKERGFTLEEIAVLFDGPAGAPQVDAAPYEAGIHAAGLDKKGNAVSGVKEADSDSEK